jgi:hypothetical protein
MYKKLEHARVERSGMSASRLNFETDRCHYEVLSDGIRFNFNIASKGGWGGYTDILLTIGVDDLPSILGDVAGNVGGATKLLLEAALHAEREQSAKLRRLSVKLATAMDSTLAASSAASIASLKQAGDQTLKGISSRSSDAHTAVINAWTELQPLVHNDDE